MKQMQSSPRSRTQRPVFVLLVWAVLTALVALPQTAFAKGERKKGDLKTVKRQELSQAAFTYQGQLRDGRGPANGAYNIQFTIYTAQTGGDEIGSIVYENTS